MRWQHKIFQPLNGLGIEFYHLNIYLRRTAILGINNLMGDLGTKYSLYGVSAERGGGAMIPLVIYGELLYGWDFLKFGANITIGDASLFDNRFDPAIIISPLIIKGIITF